MTSEVNHKIIEILTCTYIASQSFSEKDMRLWACMVCQLMSWLVNQCLSILTDFSALTNVLAHLSGQHNNNIWNLKKNGNRTAGHSHSPLAASLIMEWIMSNLIVPLIFTLNLDHRYLSFLLFCLPVKVVPEHSLQLDWQWSVLSVLLDLTGVVSDN